MRCTRVEMFLPLYVAGDLVGRRAERHVTNHLATCQRCREQAAEYDASRDLVRDAATLPPDFDSAFYAEIRRSVLDEITRERTRLAPPPPTFAGFASLFNPRFAYAASLALIFAIVAALSLHSYTGRKSEDVAHRNVSAEVNGGRTATAATTATPVSPLAKEDARPTLSLQRHAKNGNAQNETGRRPHFAKHTPSRVKRNPRVPVVATPDQITEQIASNNVGNATTSAPEVSRIEIQTSDPNIRIIWLSPKPDDAATQPLK